MGKKKKSTFQKNKDEIKYNIINSVLAGALVFAGAFSDGNITIDGILAATAASIIVAITKFKDYWSKEKSEYSSKLFKIV